LAGLLLPASALDLLRALLRGPALPQEAGAREEVAHRLRKVALVHPLSLGSLLLLRRLRSLRRFLLTLVIVALLSPAHVGVPVSLGPARTLRRRR
jgi:hypothetical protein